jgi:hypothetical protein
VQISWTDFRLIEALAVRWARLEAHDREVLAVRAVLEDSLKSALVRPRWYGDGTSEYAATVDKNSVATISVAVLLRRVPLIRAAGGCRMS